MQFEELWLLEVVIGAHPPWDGWIPFYGLPDDDPDKTGRGINQADINFYSHHIPLEVLVEELLRLFARGEIIATHLGYNRSEPTRLFIPTREEIVAGLSRGTRHPWLCYTLTEDGFKRWEAYAQPDWSVHREQGGLSGFGGDDGFIGTTAATAEVARRWIEYASDRDVLHWDREVLQIIRPWQVFPFKTLVSGVHIKVPTSAADPDETALTTDWHARETKRERLLEGIDPWYRHGVKTWEADHVS